MMAFAQLCRCDCWTAWIIDTVRWLWDRSIETKASRQEMITKEAQTLLIICHAAALKISQGLMSNGNARSRRGHQFWVERVRAGQTDKPFFFMLCPGDETL